MEVPFDIEHPLAKDLMTPGVHMLDSNAMLIEALSIMYSRKIKGLLIYDKEKEQYFQLCVNDLVSFLYHKRDFQIELKDYKVHMLMDGPIQFIDPELPVDLLIRFLLTYNYDRAYVGRDNIPMGTITRTDILQWNGLYFKPAKPMVFMILDNSSGVAIGKYVFQENLSSQLDPDLVELAGGVFSSISNIIDEVISGSGWIREIEKENFKVLFEQRQYITGILFCDNKSLDLRHRLHLATSAFCERYPVDLFKIKIKKGLLEIRDIEDIAKEFFLSAKITSDVIASWKSG